MGYMKIAIAGYGKEGRANLEYFRVKYSNAEFVIFDENADFN
jgi:UDP-N-acetylmuramoylalanine-D-glutamate ligase